jgi:HPt (histidine-containing phosphotransfer) domain-containing protein
VIISLFDLIDQGPETAEYYQHIQRASHVIKGAAANLMCHQLRQAAASLEKSAAKAYNAQDKITEEIKEEVLQLFDQFCDAAQMYNDYLNTIGV